MGRIPIGKVARAIGLGGLIGIAQHDPEGETLLGARELWLDGRRYEIEASERRPQGVVLKLKGIDDRNAADALRGKEVAVEREALPPLEEGEHYAADLVGMRLLDRAAGNAVGKIVAVAAAGGQDLLVVEREGKELLVPFADAYGPEIDREKGEVRMTLPEGLLDL